MRWTIARMEVSSPPGVSSSMTTSLAWSVSARDMPRSMYCCITGPTSVLALRTTIAPAVELPQETASRLTNTAAIAAKRAAER